MNGDGGSSDTARYRGMGQCCCDLWQRRTRRQRIGWTRQSVLRLVRLSLPLLAQHRPCRRDRLLRAAFPGRMHLTYGIHATLEGDGAQATCGRTFRIVRDGRSRSESNHAGSCSSEVYFLAHLPFLPHVCGGPNYGPSAKRTDH